MAGTKHEGVSCDACMKSNFRGRRYKCLMCYDYDLCGACRDAKAVSGRHSMDHPMQCILTRADMEIYYGGESITFDQGQSFTCPYCGEMGFNESDLGDHVGLKHPNSINDVICPICSTMQGGDPNHVTEDLLAHLNSEHQHSADNANGSGRSIGVGRGRFLGGRGGGTASTGSASASASAGPASPATVRTREQRRFGGGAAAAAANGGSQTAIAQSRTAALAGHSSGNDGNEASRPPHGHGTATATATAISESAAIQHLLPPASALVSSVRENVDSIAELLSQLTNVRRSGPAPSATASSSGPLNPNASANASSLTATFASTASSLQQLQMQLQMERQNLLFGRVENLRNGGSNNAARTGASSSENHRPLEARLTAAYMNSLPYASGDPRHGHLSQGGQQGHVGSNLQPSASKAKKDKDSHLLLDKLMEERNLELRHDNEEEGCVRADRALFIQELLIGTLGEYASLDTLDFSDNAPAVLLHQLQRENSGDSLVSTTATMGSSRAGSEFAFPISGQFYQSELTENLTGSSLSLNSSSPLTDRRPSGLSAVRSLSDSTNLLDAP